MSNAKRSKVQMASIVLLLLGASVGILALVSQDVVAQNTPIPSIAMKPTGVTVVKLGGVGIRVTRMEDSDAKVLCYMTDIGGISCVKK